MDDSRWYNSAEAYRAVQGLVREGRYQEAVDRAEQVLQEGCLGRKHAARLHSQICWLYVEHMHRTCPAAVLHGEEAVRMATLAGDQWVRTEALSRLVHAHCRLGDYESARAVCREVAREVEQNEFALGGGTSALLQLEAVVALAAGDQAGSLAALNQAAELAGAYAPVVRERVSVQRALTLLECGRYAEAREALGAGRPPAALGADTWDWELAAAWLAVVELPAQAADRAVSELLHRARAAGQAAVTAQCLALAALIAGCAQTGEAAHLARQALASAMTAGRVDLSRTLRRRLGPLLAV